METSKEKQFVCRFCDKKFPSGKSLGGHIRIHTTDYSVGYNRKGLKKNPKNKKKRKITALKQQQQQQQLCCRECGKGFESSKALGAHMDCHSEGEKMMMDNQSDTETRKRSKRVMMRQSNSESLSNGSSSSVSEIDQEDNAALTLIMMYRHSKGHNLVVNSVADSSENNSVILETKSLASGEKLEMFNVKNQVLEMDKVAVDDQLRPPAAAAADDDDNGDVLCDSESSDSDYFMNGPKKSDSDISVDQSLKSTGFGGSGINNSFNRLSIGDELRVKEEGSKYELSKRKRGLPCYENGAHSLETDSCSKIHGSSDSKSPRVKKVSGAKKKREGHECPICLRVFKSGQALGGHKRSHSFAVNQELRIENQVAEMHLHDQFDLNLPATDFDE